MTWTEVSTVGVERTRGAAEARHRLLSGDAEGPAAQAAYLPATPGIFFPLS
jgi:hypothetical protein